MNICKAGLCNRFYGEWICVQIDFKTKSLGDRSLACLISECGMGLGKVVRVRWSIISIVIIV